MAWMNQNKSTSNLTNNENKNNTMHTKVSKKHINKLLPLLAESFKLE